METYTPFQKAVPVWAAGRESEMNVTCRFTASVKPEKTLLRMTGSAAYRVFVNGKFTAYGPARGPKGWFRVDEVDLTEALTEEENFVLFEVVGYNINNFYLLDQPSFFQCEIIQHNEAVAYTAPTGGMPCDVVTERVQKVQKYTFQRTFTESWRLGPAYAESYRQMTPGRTVLADEGEKHYLPRRVPFASLKKLPAAEIVGSGSFVREDREIKYRGWSLIGISKEQKGFPEKELEDTLSADHEQLVFTCDETERRPIAPDEVLSVADGRFVTVSLASNLTGFIGMHVQTKRTVTVTVLFDELFNGDVDALRMGVDIIRYVLKPGEYELLSMDPYTMQYIKVFADGGDITVSDIHLAEYAAPDEGFAVYRSDNPKLMKIWDAAVETYRQNALDLYTDCPCRERAGWLCDSFWTARSEYALTGKSVVEKNFLENFLIPDEFEYLPKGMFPMCYPADHNDGTYIPNWAMWLVMELREYLDRSGDREMVDAFREKIYALFAFLDAYKNEDGLLEKLDKWVFVEWSKANDLVQDVNFPTNMLYAACKQAAGEMYGDPAMLAEAETMRETIRRLSYNGKFFTDHLVRNAQGILENPGEQTEVCQYYAFYLGVATPEGYPELWNTLIYDFGPYRKENDKYPEIYPANAFIGNYLRLDMMARNNRMKEVLENIEGYFYKMAIMTGTLWENDSASASLDHGFASHVLVWLLRAANEKQ